MTGYECTKSRRCSNEITSKSWWIPKTCSKISRGSKAVCGFISWCKKWVPITTIYCWLLLQSYLHDCKIDAIFLWQGNCTLIILMPTWLNWILNQILVKEVKRKCSCIEIGNCTITHFTVTTINLDAIAMESPANCHSEQYSGFSPFEYWFLVQTFVYLRPHPQNRFVDSSLFPSVGHDRSKILTRKTGMNSLAGQCRDVGAGHSLTRLLLSRYQSAMFVTLITCYYDQHTLFSTQTTGFILGENKS